MKKNILRIIFLVCIVIWSTSIITMADTNIPSGIGPSLPSNDYSQTVKGATVKIIGTLMWIGYSIGIGMIIYVGIKYVMASADEKASLKGMFVKIVIGALIIVSATTITNIALSLFSTSGTTKGSSKSSSTISANK